MRSILITLILLCVAGLGWTVSSGALLDGPEALREHLLWGVTTAFVFCFTHLLVLFYLIGTEGDIKEALEERPELAREYVPRVKRLKLICFPAGSTAVLLTIVAAMLGAWVHSSLLLEAPPEQPPPLRGVPFWWTHLAAVILLVPANVWAFARELGAVRENRRTIDEINDRLAREAASPAGAGGDRRPV